MTIGVGLGCHDDVDPSALFLEEESDKALKQTLESFKTQGNYVLARFVWNQK
jgi:hypothetical protein